MPLYEGSALYPNQGHVLIPGGVYVSFQISSSKALNAMYVDRPCCLTNSGGDDVQKHACQAFPWFFLETVRDRLGTVLGTVQRPLGFP